MTDRRLGLIGSSGFVGGALSRSQAFEAKYNSKNIEAIAGAGFDVLVCAGAPAAMWAANARPEEDLANLENLMGHMQTAQVRKLVLISTIAVFDNPSAGYTETTAQYETTKAYGRNRRRLEEHVSDAFDAHILRLPALFGPGLKKNFIFDLLNPVPSFIRGDKFDALIQNLEEREAKAFQHAYSFDAELSMWKCDRSRLKKVSGVEIVEDVLRREGLVARNFTNSESRFQYYNVARLWSDIETCLNRNIRVLNVCSEPASAAEVHKHLVDEPFSNMVPPLNIEDVKTVHAGIFGRNGPYMIGQAEILSELRAFFREEAVRQ